MDMTSKKGAFRITNGVPICRRSGSSTRKLSHIPISCLISSSNHGRPKAPWPNFRPSIHLTGPRQACERKQGGEGGPLQLRPNAWGGDRRVELMALPAVPFRLDRHRKPACGPQLARRRPAPLHPRRVLDRSCGFHRAPLPSHLATSDQSSGLSKQAVGGFLLLAPLSLGYPDAALSPPDRAAP